MTEKRIAVITGASSGIGRAAAIGFARAGYRIAICGRRASALEETLAAAGQPGGLAEAADVADPGQVAHFFARIKEHYGRVDVLFNNAGRSAPAVGIGDFDTELWRQVVDTNLSGAFYAAREAFRLMRDQDPQGGRIINNGSISAHVPRPHAVAYNATKHAISGLTKSISLDGRPYSIACGQIDIGNAATDMTASMQTGMLQADGSTRPEPVFDVQHVVDAVLHMTSLPLDANIQTMTVMATNMPYTGRG